MLYPNIFCIYLQVTTNGIIYIGDRASECCPINFENIPFGATSFVAPYWIDNDPLLRGNVSYEVHREGSQLLRVVSEYISNNQSVEFSGVWMLAAFWLDVPEHFIEEQVNTLITSK